MIAPLAARPIAERRRLVQRPPFVLRVPAGAWSLVTAGVLLALAFSGSGVSVLEALLGLGLFSAWRLRLDAERQRRLRAEREARTDALTALLNRRGLDEALAASLAARQPLSLLLLDLDHFKRINDGHGHLTGDRVLREAAQALRAGLRVTDTLGRWGGEEFLVLLPGVGHDAARLVAERLREHLSAVVRVRGESVTASIGVASAAQWDRAEQLLARADSAVYAAKRGGRNRTVVEGDLDEDRSRYWN